MTVAFDQYSTASRGTGNFSWTHTPVGTPKGVIVLVAQNAATSNEVSTVTYGGVSMAFVASAIYTAGNEDGVVAAYFLGTSVPTGGQTVAIVVSGGNAKHPYCITVTGAGDTEVADTTAIQATTIDPSGTLSLGGAACFCALAYQTGAGDITQNAPLSGWTELNEDDIGTQLVGCYTYNTVGTADVTFGVDSTITEDYAILGIAVTESAPPPVTLVIADSTYAHAADTFALTQVHALAVAEATHAHLADGFALTQVHILTLADAAHAHTADGLTLSVDVSLIVAAADHAHAADNLDLTQAHQLAVADAEHANTIASFALTQAHQLVLQDADHAHAIADLDLTQVHVLLVAAADHAHTADDLVLAVDGTLAVADLAHGHLLAALDLTQTHVLAVATALHGHTIDQLTLTQTHYLILDDATHPHAIDALTLSTILAATPGARVLIIEAESRTLMVANENRVLEVPYERRTINVYH